MKTFSALLSSILTFTLALLIASTAMAQSLAIKVKKGTVSYRVTTQVLGGIGSQTVSAANNDLTGEVTYKNQLLTGKLVIPVKSFRSGNSTLDEHVLGILKAEQYPEIFFRIMEMALDEESLKKLLTGEAKIQKVRGELTVAGVSKIYDFDIRVEKLEKNLFRLSTEKEVKFTDFGITPPSFGGFLSTAPDQIFIAGEIFLTAEQ